MWLITCMVCFTSILFYIVWQRKRPKNYPPGPVNWFGIWSLLVMRNADPFSPHEALRKLSKKYGDIMSISLGVHPAVVFSKYEDMLQIFTKEELSARYQFPFIKERCFGKELGILLTSGDAWRTIRKFSEKSLKDFGFRKPEFYGELLEAEFEQFSKNFEKSATENAGIVEFESNFGLTMVRVIFKFLFGFESQECDVLLQRLYDTTEDVVNAVAFDNVNLMYPFLRKIVPRLTGHHRDMSVFKEQQLIAKQLIEHMKRRGNEDSASSTFARAFQKEVDKHTGDAKTRFTEEQMIITLLDMFLAGSETSSHFLGFCILHLVRNPEMQERLYAEIRSVAPAANEIPAYADLSKMTFLQAFLFEIYRFCNIVPVVGRRASVDYTYRGFFIPKGTCVMFNLHCVFTDPEYWGDPQIFRPERFLDEFGNLIKTERLAVFGFGKRLCLGASVAKQTGFVYLAGMIKKFKFQIPLAQLPPSDVPKSSFTSRPRPFKAHVTRRH